MEKILAERNDPMTFLKTEFSALQSEYKASMELAKLVQPLKTKLTEVNSQKIFEPIFNFFPVERRKNQKLNRKEYGPCQLRNQHQKF